MAVSSSIIPALVILVNAEIREYQISPPKKTFDSFWLILGFYGTGRIRRTRSGCGMQRQGREKEAIYNQLLKNENIDIWLTTTASNNLIPINKDQNIFESKKRIKSATVKGLEAKLNFAQRFF